MDDDASITRKKLLHRARYRGFREADLLIGGFAEAALPGMDEAALAAFGRLLDLNDHDLYAAIVGESPAPAGFEALIEDMRAYCAQRPLRPAP